MRHYHIWSAIIIATSLASCVDPDEPPTSETEQPLLGTTAFGADCTSADLAFLNQTLHYGRAAVASRAFEQCVEQTMQTGLTTFGFTYGPYRKCTGDPFYDASFSTQVQQVLDAARSGNGLNVACSGGGGNASASIGTYDQIAPESLAFSGWLRSVIQRRRAGRK